MLKLERKNETLGHVFHILIEISIIKIIDIETKAYVFHPSLIILDIVNQIRKSIGLILSDRQTKNQLSGWAGFKRSAGRLGPDLPRKKDTEIQIKSRPSTNQMIGAVWWARMGGRRVVGVGPCPWIWMVGGVVERGLGQKPPNESWWGSYTGPSFSSFYPTTRSTPLPSSLTRPTPHFPTPSL